MPASPVEIIVYNQANIQLWTDELLANQVQIAGNLRAIQVNSDALKPYVHQLADINIQILQLEVHDISHHHGPHYYNGHVYAFEDMAYEAHKNDLLRRLRTTAAGIKSNIRAYNEAIAMAQNSNKILTKRNSWLEKHLFDGNSFLQTLHNNPAELTYILHSKIMSMVNEYEKKHFIGLSPQVRISLLLIKTSLNALIDGTDDPYIQRQNYLRVCAFLCELYFQVHTENKDKDFIQSIAKLLEDVHIQPSGDLPDALKSNFNAAAWYQSVKDARPDCFALSECNLLAVEQANYEYAVDLIMGPHQVSDSFLNKKINDVVWSIYDEVRHKRQKNKVIDYHFYTQLLQQLHFLSLHPEDKLTAQRLTTMAEHASGSPSVGKQVLGGLLVVLGVLTIAASITALAFTFGSSSILSAWGMALGLGLIQAQCVAGVSLSLTAVAGAGLTFWGGSAIKAGTRQGISRELLDLTEEALRSPPSYTP